MLKKGEAELLALQNFGGRRYQELRESLDELGILAVDADWDNN